MNSALKENAARSSLDPMDRRKLQSALALISWWLIVRSPHLLLWSTQTAITVTQIRAFRIPLKPIPIKERAPKTTHWMPISKITQ